MAESVSESFVYRIDGADYKFRTVTEYDPDIINPNHVTNEGDVQPKLQFKTTEANFNTVKAKDSSLVSEVTLSNGTKQYWVTVGTRLPRTAGSTKNWEYTSEAGASLRRSMSSNARTAITKKSDEATVNGLAKNVPDLDADKWNEIVSLSLNKEKPNSLQETLSGVLSDIQNLDFNISAGEGRSKVYEDLSYPEDIRSIDFSQDVIKFTMFYQSKRSVNFNFINQNDAQGNPQVNLSGIVNPVSLVRETTAITGSVTLPIQSGIQDTNQVSFKSSTINPFVAGLAGVAADPISAGAAVLDALKGTTGAGMQEEMNKEEFKNAIKALKVYLAQSAVGGSGLLPRFSGAILNPNMELLLDAPTLRNFTFNFKLSARSATEATQIRKIIRFFKQGMSVKRSSSSLFIVTPNLFRIRYLTGGKDHPSIGRIKECALTSLNTRYTPDGTYMTYDDPSRTMTSYEISMSFTELDPLTENDYSGAEDIAGTENFLLRPTIEEEIGLNSIGY